MPDRPTPSYEVYALRYATAPERKSQDNFIFPDIHDAPMPLDFYIWAIRGQGRTIVLDTGFSEAAAKRRQRVFLRSPGAALDAIGIDAAAVQDVVISHLHYDHAGNMDLFPRATFHLQDAEMAYSTGRCMCHAVLRRPMEVEDVLTAVRHVYADRVRFHDGTGEIAPDVTVHLVGGHSGGLQVVRVPTARGWVVLANDATHFWANIRNRSPFPLVADVGRMLEGFRIVEELADGPDHIIPGHDPLVLTRFPAVKGQPEIVRLDAPPTG
ncbi:MAG: N-acyl homoserine lactonase family protein [Acidisphaera sp.]|nr:N-acyl homoserine lactonase family protein [Acidisphaera sp.]